MSEAYKLGVKIKELGKSIYYNPFRHKGSAENYNDFIDGYNS